MEAGKIERRPLPTSVHRLERAQSFREQETKLFLTYQKPHHAVSASTISRWVKSLLKRAGVDSSKFGAHSTRAASSSAAKQAGVPIMDILSTGEWSSERTFARHYSVPIQKKNNFAEAIFAEHLSQDISCRFVCQACKVTCGFGFW